MKIAMDLGRSGIRATTGDNDVLTCSSTYKVVEASTRTREDGSDSYDDFTIVTSPLRTLNGKRIIKGDSMNFYNGMEIYPDNQKHKIEQDSTYINFIYTVGKLLLEKQFDTEMDVLKVAICLPVIEFFGNDADTLKGNLEGKYDIKFNVLGTSVQFELRREDITVAAEGVCAAVPLLKNADIAKEIKSNIVVIVDAGRGSTDITVLYKGKPKGISARSFSIGGITLETRVSADLERNNYLATKSNVQSAITTGRVTIGNSYAEVGELVSECKRVLAQAIVKSIKEVINYDMIGQSEVTGILPVGRCFLTTAEVSTGNLMDFITEEWGYEINVYNNSTSSNDEGIANLMGLWELINKA